MTCRSVQTELGPGGLHGSEGDTGMYIGVCIPEPIFLLDSFVRSKTWVSVAYRNYLLSKICTVRLFARLSMLVMHKTYFTEVKYFIHGYLIQTISDNSDNLKLVCILQFVDRAMQYWYMQVNANLPLLDLFESILCWLCLCGVGGHGTWGWGSLLSPRKTLRLRMLCGALSCIFSASQHMLSGPPQAWTPWLLLTEPYLQCK